MAYIWIMTDAPGPALTRFAPLVRAGLIVGVVLAAVTYPLAALAGLGAKAGAGLVGRLPTELRVAPQAQTTYVYAADGKTLLTMFYEEHRRYTPIEQISPYIQQAIVAAEDARFFEHHGVDVRGIVRAFVANRAAGGVSQGASTLTMQYVRIALRDGAQTPAEAIAATEQTTQRKIREMRLATRLEEQLSKTQILERYLNAAYFGHRAYGVFAAAQIFFSKAPKDLTLGEAATLAGLVQAPSTYDPAGTDRGPATERRNYVIDRMVGLGYVSPQAAAQAQKQPIRLKLSTPPNDCISVSRKHNSWGFFCDFFKTWWLSQPAFGASVGEREDQLRRGGYRVVTSLDPKVQTLAQRNVLKNLSYKSQYANGAVFVEPGTGQVRAMAVNRVYSLDQRHNGPNTDRAKRGKVPSNYPNTVNPLLGGGDLPGYQAGSTFKLFTLLAALDAGFKMSKSFYAPQRYRSKYLAGPGEPSSCGGRWCPQNASGSMTGRQNMWTGFGKSVNTYFVQLEQAVGADRVVRMAERLGLTWRTDVDKMMASPGRAKTWGAFTLGVADTTPLEMANAYATAAADGKYCEPTPVISITDRDGKPATYTPDGARSAVEIAQPRCTQAVSKAAARAAVDAARCVTGYRAARGSCGSWSTGSAAYPMIRRPFAGKTGTTDNTRTAWFIGFTPELAGASFVADPDNPRNAVGDRFYNDPIEVVAHTIRDALAGKPVRHFTPPPASILR
jgi:membrane peptidoglycan carboxypeptidase